MWTCNKCNSADVLGGKILNIQNTDIFEVLCSECVQLERLNPEDQLSGISGELVCDSPNPENK